MSNNHTEVVDESRPPIPKDPGALVIRYYSPAYGWNCVFYGNDDEYTKKMYDTIYSERERYPAARLIRILPEGEGKP